MICVKCEETMGVADLGMDAEKDVESRMWLCRRCNRSEIEYLPDRDVSADTIPGYDEALFKLRICICPCCGKKHWKKVFYTGAAKFPPYRCGIRDSKVKRLPSDELVYNHNIPKEIL